jgi:hypothetical protein
MNLLFERVRIQAQLSRLYDLVTPDQADEIVHTAWQIERARRAKTLQQQLIDKRNQELAAAK